MTNDHDELFAPLEPPKGGVERFRAKLAAETAGREPHSYRRPAALAAVVLVLALSAVLYLHVGDRGAITGKPAYAAPEFDRLLGRESKPLPLRVELNDRPVAVEQLESDDPRVKIYRLP
jgi:hypothetical protein